MNVSGAEVQLHHLNEVHFEEKGGKKKKEMNVDATSFEEYAKECKDDSAIQASTRLGQNWRRLRREKVAEVNRVGKGLEKQKSFLFLPVQPTENNKTKQKAPQGRASKRLHSMI